MAQGRDILISEISKYKEFPGNYNSPLIAMEGLLNKISKHYKPGDESLKSSINEILNKFSAFLEKQTAQDSYLSKVKQKFAEVKFLVNDLKQSDQKQLSSQQDHLKASQQPTQNSDAKQTAEHKTLNSTSQKKLPKSFGMNGFGSIAENYQDKFSDLERSCEEFFEEFKPTQGKEEQEFTIKDGDTLLAKLENLLKQYKSEILQNDWFTIEIVNLFAKFYEHYQKLNNWTRCNNICVRMLNLFNQNIPQHNKIAADFYFKKAIAVAHCGRIEEAYELCRKGKEKNSEKKEEFEQCQNHLNDLKKQKIATSEQAISSNLSRLGEVKLIPTLKIAELLYEVSQLIEHTKQLTEAYYKTVQEKCTAALELCKPLPLGSAILYRAQANFNLKEYKLAEVDVNILIEKFNDPSGYYYKALILKKQNKDQLAYDHFIQAMNLELKANYFSIPQNKILTLMMSCEDQLFFKNGRYPASLSQWNSDITAIQPPEEKEQLTSDEREDAEEILEGKLANHVIDQLAETTDTEESLLDSIMELSTVLQVIQHFENVIEAENLQENELFFERAKLFNRFIKTAAPNNPLIIIARKRCHDDLIAARWQLVVKILSAEESEKPSLEQQLADYDDYYYSLFIITDCHEFLSGLPIPNSIVLENANNLLDQVIKHSKECTVELVNILENFCGFYSRSNQLPKSIEICNIVIDKCKELIKTNPQTAYGSLINANSIKSDALQKLGRLKEAREECIAGLVNIGKIRKILVPTELKSELFSLYEISFKERLQKLTAQDSKQVSPNGDKSAIPLLPTHPKPIAISTVVTKLDQKTGQGAQARLHLIDFMWKKFEITERNQTKGSSANNNELSFDEIFFKNLLGCETQLEPHKTQICAELSREIKESKDSLLTFDSHLFFTRALVNFDIIASAKTMQTSDLDPVIQDLKIALCICAQQRSYLANHQPSQIHEDFIHFKKTYDQINLYIATYNKISGTLHELSKEHLPLFETNTHVEKALANELKRFSQNGKKFTAPVKPSQPSMELCFPQNESQNLALRIAQAEQEKKAKREKLRKEKEEKAALEQKALIQKEDGLYTQALKNMVEQKFIEARKNLLELINLLNKQEAALARFANDRGQKIFDALINIEKNLFKSNSNPPTTLALAFTQSITNAKFEPPLLEIADEKFRGPVLEFDHNLFFIRGLANFVPGQVEFAEDIKVAIWICRYQIKILKEKYEMERQKFKTVISKKAKGYDTQATSLSRHLDSMEQVLKKIEDRTLTQSDVNVWLTKPKKDFALLIKPSAKPKVTNAEKVGKPKVKRNKSKEEKPKKSEKANGIGTNPEPKKSAETKKTEATTKPESKASNDGTTSLSPTLVEAAVKNKNSGKSNSVSVPVNATTKKQSQPPHPKNNLNSQNAAKSAGEKNIASPAPLTLTAEEQAKKTLEDEAKRAARREKKRVKEEAEAQLKAKAEAAEQARIKEEAEKLKAQTEAAEQARIKAEAEKAQVEAAEQARLQEVEATKQARLKEEAEAAQLKAQIEAEKVAEQIIKQQAEKQTRIRVEEKKLPVNATLLQKQRTVSNPNYQGLHSYLPNNYQPPIMSYQSTYAPLLQLQIPKRTESSLEFSPIQPSPASSDSSIVTPHSASSHMSHDSSRDSLRTDSSLSTPLSPEYSLDRISLHSVSSLNSDLSMPASPETPADRSPTQVPRQSPLTLSVNKPFNLEDYKLANYPQAKRKSLPTKILLPDTAVNFIKELKEKKAELTFAVGNLVRDPLLGRSGCKVRKNGTIELDIDLVTQADMPTIQKCISNLNLKANGKFYYEAKKPFTAENGVEGISIVKHTYPHNSANPEEHIVIISSKYFKEDKYKSNPIRFDALSRDLYSNTPIADENGIPYIALEETLDVLNNREVRLVDQRELDRLDQNQFDEKESPETLTYKKDARRIIRAVIPPVTYDKFNYSQGTLDSFTKENIKLLLQTPNGNPKDQKHIRQLNIFLNDKIYSRNGLEASAIFKQLLDLGIGNILFPGLREATINNLPLAVRLNYILQNFIRLEDIFAGFMILQNHSSFAQLEATGFLDKDLKPLISKLITSNPIYQDAFVQHDLHVKDEIREDVFRNIITCLYNSPEAEMINKHIQTLSSQPENTPKKATQTSYPANGPGFFSQKQQFSSFHTSHSNPEFKYHPQDVRNKPSWQNHGAQNYQASQAGYAQRGRGQHYPQTSNQRGGFVQRGRGRGNYSYHPRQFQAPLPNNLVLPDAAPVGQTTVPIRQFGKNKFNGGQF